MPNSVPAQPQLRGIQYLRGLAAFAVLFFHLGEAYDFDFTVGKAGVDVFFVISGFVMWFTTFNRDMTFSSFMLKRIQRLVPLYWIATVVTAVFIVLKPQFFWGVEVNAAGMAQSLLFIPYYSTPGNLWPILMQGWTLNLEMFFYLIFAALLALRFPQRLYGLTAILLLLVAMGYACNFANPVLATWTRPWLLEFLAGIWLAHFYINARINNLRLGYALAASGVIMLAAVHMSSYLSSSAEILLFGIPAICIVTGVLIVERAGRLPRIPALSLFGNASYSIYLWHYLVITIIGAICLRLGITNNLAIATMSGLAALPVLLLLYWLIERNFVMFFHRKNPV